MAKFERLHGPAKGAGYGGPANGAGWGGPVKGMPPAWKPGEVQPHTGKVIANGERMREIIADLAENGEHEMTRLKAAEAYLNRTEGLPVARNVTVTVDELAQLDNDALRREREAIESEIAAHTAGRITPSDES